MFSHHYHVSHKQSDSKLFFHFNENFYHHHLTLIVLTPSKSIISVSLSPHLSTAKSVNLIIVLLYQNIPWSISLYATNSMTSLRIIQTIIFLYIVHMEYSWFKNLHTQCPCQWYSYEHTARFYQVAFTDYGNDMILTKSHRQSPVTNHFISSATVQSQQQLPRFQRWFILP